LGKAEQALDSYPSADSSNSGDKIDWGQARCGRCNWMYRELLKSQSSMPEFMRSEVTKEDRVNVPDIANQQCWGRVLLEAWCGEAMGQGEGLARSKEMEGLRRPKVGWMAAMSPEMYLEDLGWGKVSGQGSQNVFL
jgi:hypothetical protein